MDKPPVSQAILHVSEKELDFGLYDSNCQDEHNGVAVLTVRNDGDLILVGRIASQVAWLTIDPPNFRLNPGESSDHVFRMQKVTPAYQTSHRLGSDFIALINSNGGSETLGGYYFTRITEQIGKKKNPIRFSTILMVLGVLFLGVGIVWGIYRAGEMDFREKEQQQIAAVLTNAVETYVVEYAQSNPTVTPPPIIENPLVNQEKRELENATMTPWPRDAYPMADQFVISFYDALNMKDYNTAWWMLSENLQQICCYSGGGIPYDNFVAGWSDVERVEVVYAYLQAYDVNPAEVTVQLIYHYADSSQEMFYTEKVISDSVRNTLLIDEIK